VQTLEAGEYQQGKNRLPPQILDRLDLGKAPDELPAEAAREEVLS